jgi:PAS domain S-box-containing protein
MSNERNKLFYYFNINLSSIQGRITSGFVITLVMAIALLFLNNLLWWQMESKKEVIISQIKPIQSECVKFMNLTRETQVNMIQFSYLGDRKYEEENKKYWLVDIPAQKDTLWHYIKLYNNQEIKLLYTEVNKYLGELKQQQRFLERSLSTGQDQFALKQQVKNDLIHAQSELEKTIKKLINRANQNEKKLLREIAQDRQRNDTILVFSALLGFLGAYSLGIFLFTQIFKWIREVRDFMAKLSQGNFPDDIPTRNNEFRNIINYSNELKSKLFDLDKYIQEIANKKLETSKELFDNKGQLGESLEKMQKTLQVFSKEEKQRAWTTEGLSVFSEILRNHDDNIQNLCSKIIGRLVGHVDAVQGGVFLLNKEETHFELAATYAFGREKFIQKKVEVSEGLLGRVYHEKNKVYLEELPENYTYISSGLGNTLPRTLILLPLIDENKQVKGVIELATLRSFAQYEIDFLENLSTSIASTILVISAYLDNQLLLDEFQKNTASLEQKERESHQITKDLENARHEIEHQLHKVHRENEKLNAVLSNIMEAIVISNIDGKIEVFNQASERLFGWDAEDAIGKNIKILMPATRSREHDKYIDEYLETKEKKTIGTGRLIEGKHKRGYIFPVHLSITEVTVEEETLFTAIFRKVEEPEYPDKF